MTKIRKCIICGGKIPAPRGVRATTCSPECNAKKPETIHKPHPERRESSSPPNEYEKALLELGLNQVQAARLFGIDPRTSRRYVSGSLRTPPNILDLLSDLVKTKRQTMERRKSR